MRALGDELHSALLGPSHSIGSELLLWGTQRRVHRCILVQLGVVRTCCRLWVSELSFVALPSASGASTGESPGKMEANAFCDHTA